MQRHAVSGIRKNVKNYDENTTGAYETAIKEEGLTQVTFTPAQTAELNKLAESVRAEWIKKYSKDFDAQALFDFTSKLFSK